MDYSNRHWVILNVNDITDEMIKVSLQSGRETLRKSLDKSQAILKWKGNTPNCFDGMTIYSHSEILEILKGEDWNGLG
jgi:hypothetical protein